MIKEELARGLGEGAVWKAPYHGPKVVMGGVYRNPKGHVVTVRYFEDDVVDYDYASGGREESVVDADLDDLQKLLVTGGFGPI